MDGTFKTCPRPFYQFVTIHGLYLERAIPFVMVLMSGKTEAMYRAVLRHVKRRIQRIRGQRCVCLSVHPSIILSFYHSIVISVFLFVYLGGCQLE